VGGAVGGAAPDGCELEDDDDPPPLAPAPLELAGGAAVIVPTEPVQLPPAASRTVRLAEKVPAAYAWLTLVPEPAFPSPNVHAYVYGARPPVAPALKSTCRGAVPATGVAVVLTLNGV